jgi:hypothetical protein
MIAVLVAVALAQGARPTHAPPTAVEIANEQRLAATPGLLAQYFEPPKRVHLEPSVSFSRPVVSGDCMNIYSIGPRAGSNHLLRRSLATGQVTVGPEMRVHGDLYTLPNEPDEMVLAWQQGGASGPYGVGFIDLHSGRIEPFVVCGETPPQRWPSEAGSASGSAVRSPVDDAEGFSTGEIAVAPSGRFLAIGAYPSVGDCYLPEYMVFNTATKACEYRFVPTASGTEENQGQGETAEATADGCGDTWIAFWHEGDILRVYRLGAGYRVMFEVSRNSADEWRSSQEKPVQRVTEVERSRYLSPGERRLVLSRGADGPSFEIDPTALFPGENGGLSVVYGPCCVVILHAVDQGKTHGKTGEAVILRWKGSPVPVHNE